MRLLVEIVRLIVMPANCRLLFPSMEDRQRDEGCERGIWLVRDQNKHGLQNHLEMLVVLQFIKASQLH